MFERHASVGAYHEIYGSRAQDVVGQEGLLLVFANCGGSNQYGEGEQRGDSTKHGTTPTDGGIICRPGGLWKTVGKFLAKDLETAAIYAFHFGNACGIQWIPPSHSPVESRDWRGFRKMWCAKS
jgi:hypothetical protein